MNEHSMALVFTKHTLGTVDGTETNKTWLHLLRNCWSKEGHAKQPEQGHFYGCQSRSQFTEKLKEKIQLVIS